MNKVENINYEDLANFLCGDNSPEAQAAHEAYSEAYDEAHTGEDTSYNI